MSLKRLLIVPSPRLGPNPTHAVPQQLYQRLKQRLNIGPITHEGELLYFGDVPKILGPDNTFFYSHPFDHRLAHQQPEANCPYPACHGLTLGRFINQHQLTHTIKKVDAVLVSIVGGHRTQQAIQLARSHNIPVAVLDRPDHEALYGATDIATKMFRGLTPHRDFDLYFKQDLLPGYETELTRPLSPLPIRATSYHFKPLPKNTPLFYSGRPRPDKCQADRAEIVSLVQQEFPEANIVIHTTRDSFMSSRQYLDSLSRAHIALSPSGRVWDSYRHCEIGLAPGTALLAPEPYSVTAGPPLRDGHNAILYRTELRNHKYHLNDPTITAKIRYYLNHRDELRTIARRWAHDVTTSHTTEARARYITSEISQLT